MHAFKDATGREWVASLTVGSLKRARELAGVDLAAAAIAPKPGEDGGGVLAKIAADPALLAATLHAISTPAGGASKPSLDEFCDALDGDTVEACADALVAEIVDFFPKPIRDVMSRKVETAKRNREAAMARIASGEGEPTPSA